MASADEVWVAWKDDCDAGAHWVFLGVGDDREAAKEIAALDSSERRLSLDRVLGRRVSVLIWRAPVLEDTLRRRSRRMEIANGPYGHCYVITPEELHHDE